MVDDIINFRNMRVPVTWVNIPNMWFPNPNPISDCFLLVSECLWLPNLSVTPTFLPLIPLVYPLFISMFPLSVFLLTVFGLSLCFSCPRHPQEDPKTLAVPGIISSMFIDVEDSLGYWQIPEANCNTVVSQ